MSPQCVECGKEAPRLLGGSCPSCFAAAAHLLELAPVVDLELCAHCDARHVGAQWNDPAEWQGVADLREQAVRAALTVHPEVRNAEVTIAQAAQDERATRATVRLAGTVEGVPVAAEAETLVRLRRMVCDRCSRMFGGSYAAILQLRASERDVSASETERAHKMIGGELDRLRAGGSREAYLAKSEAVPGGHDYYLGDIEGARAVARLLLARLGATLQESAKLVGRREGMDVYRVTFLVRIRTFAPGDFALLDDEPVQVGSVERGKCICYHLADHRRDRVEEPRLRRLGGPEILVRALVISFAPGTLQVMDPESYHTHDLSPPPDWAPAGESVWALRHDGRLYLPRTVPPEPEEPQTPKRRTRVAAKAAAEP
ncbi:MAG: 60S ribosomal export protein NMD3 [Thermoplasmatota archaeon]